MRANRKYLFAVALLAVLAVVFGLAGTVAPVSEVVSPQQSSSSSESVTHFMNPPTFDSEWVNIIDKCGQYFNITHNLDTTEVFVDIMGKQNLNGIGGEHQRNLGGTGFTPGWNRTYGTQFNDWAYSVVQTGDGGYAIAGNIYYYAPWLLKTDSTGNVQWSQTYEGAERRMLYSLVQTFDGGYALAGEASYYDFWLVKTDSAGDALWSQTYGGAELEEACSVVQTFDGGYALAGYTSPVGQEESDVWLVKTNSTGNVQWSQTYGFWSYEYADSMVQTSDGGYAIAGRTGSLGVDWDFYVVKTDATGNMLWNKTYGGADWEGANSLVQTSDGGYAIAGYTESYGAGVSDFWLVKTDSAGNMLWNKTYGGLFSEEARSVVQTFDGGYALLGETNDPYGFGYEDILLVKMGTEVGLAWTGLTNSTITLYRGTDDVYWNYMRVRIWTIEEPTWQYGDINQDGVVDVQDLYILGKNYGKTLSLLSLSGIIAIAGIHTYKKRKQPK